MSETDTTPAEEAAARTICAGRGADPDGPVTLGYPEGGKETFDPGWLGYVTLARAVIAAIEAATDGEGDPE